MKPGHRFNNILSHLKTPAVNYKIITELHEFLKIFLKTVKNSKFFRKWESFHNQLWNVNFHVKIISDETWKLIFL